MREILNVATSLIEPLGTPDFFDSLYQQCQDLLRNDQCNIFHFDAQRRPTCLFSMATEPRMRRITRQCVTNYLSNGFQRDQNFKLATASRGFAAGSILRHLRAQEVIDPTYRRTFYSFAEVREKISLAFRDASGTFYINLYRNADQDSYSDNELALMSDASDVICQLVAKHHRLTAPESVGGFAGRAEDNPLHEDRRADLVRRIRQALLNDASGLSEREAEVCAAIACGITTEGISLELDISPNTVATHRKRAYAKLGISSQAELFAKFYSSVGRHAFSRLQ